MAALKRALAPIDNASAKNKSRLSKTKVKRKNSDKTLHFFSTLPSFFSGASPLNYLSFARSFRLGFQPWRRCFSVKRKKGKDKRFFCITCFVLFFLLLSSFSSTLKIFFSRCFIVLKLEENWTKNKNSFPLQLPAVFRAAWKSRRPISPP